jgi:uncharacterized oxidoreductase
VETKGNTVLITGGATGIGFCMARAFARAGNKVTICGRRKEKLLEAQKSLSGLEVKVCDVSSAEDREELARWAASLGVNVLVNNAGMQRMVDFTRGLAALREGDNEIRCNLEGPVYLTAAMVPRLMKLERAAVVNVSSGLGFVPIAVMPVYCATKAALHSFSVSLRHQLAASGVKVFEVIPPTVDTELDRGSRAKRGLTNRGIPPEEVAQAVMEGMAADRYEIAVGTATGIIKASRENFDLMFQRMNGAR